MELHAGLAIRDGSKELANKLTTETNDTVQKPERLTGYDRSLQMVELNRENEEAAGQEIKEITTTIPAKLNYWAFTGQVPFVDINLQIELANQEGSADLILDGETEPILNNCPGTFLLFLEKHLTKLRSTFESCATHQPGIEWEPCDKGPGIFKAKYPMVTNKTEKTLIGVILAPATDKHQAVVEKINVDKVIGMFTTLRYTGTISVADKSAMLGRLETLIRATQKARMKAAKVELKDIKVGDKIFNFILNGK